LAYSSEARNARIELDDLRRSIWGHAAIQTSHEAATDQSRPCEYFEPIIAFQSNASQQPLALRYGIADVRQEYNSNSLDIILKTRAGLSVTETLHMRARLEELPRGRCQRSGMQLRRTVKPEGEEPQTQSHVGIPFRAPRRSTLSTRVL
jgi:hypothetical protein